MAMTTAQLTDAYRFFSIAFDAAPGVTYMNQLAEAYAAGMTTKQVVNVFTTKEQFTATYPEFMTNEAFATKLIGNVVGTSATDAAKAEAVADVQAALASGMTRGDVIYQIFDNLANKAADDAKWGSTAKLLANKVAVAQFVTETQTLNSTDLAVLRATLANVTAQTPVSTPEELAAAASKPFSITTSAAAVDEGGSVTVSIANGAANTEYAVKIAGVQATDITGDFIRVLKTDASGAASATVSTVADRATEGAETLTFSVVGRSDTASVTINDTSLDNTAPVITAAATLVATEDTAATFTATAADPESDLVTVTAAAANGTVTQAADGSWSYTGKQDFNGADTITVTATDALGKASTQTIAVTVAAVNDAATITTDATVEASEETATSIKVSTADVDGDTVTLTASALNGTVVDNKDGSFTYTGNKDFAGADTVTFTANDGTVDTVKTVAVNVKNVNDAPVAQAATASAKEAGPVVTGMLTATDVDAGDTHTFALDAAVEGLTLNADGSYSFDATKNTKATALKYNDAAEAITANYTVTDAGGLTSKSTLTITVTPTPLTFELKPSAAFVEEGQTISYKLVASEAVATAVTGSVQVVPGNGSAGQTAANDFGSGALNPQNVTIAAGQTESTLFNLIPQNDAATEIPESYTAKATVTGYTIADVTGEVRDPSTVGGVGQTFTLTTGIDSIPGMIGSANSTGTDGDDTIVGLLDTTGKSSTLSTLDAINGGLGTDTLRLNDLDPAGSTLPGGLTVTNVENVTIRGAGAVKLDTTAWTGVTSLKSTLSTAATLTADKATAVDVSGATGAVAVDGGASQMVNTAGAAVTLGATTVSTGAIAVTHTKQAANAIDVDGGSTVSVTASGVTSGTVKVGQGGAATDLATGAVTITSAGAAYVTKGTDALGQIDVNGGTTVSVTQSAFANTTDAAKDVAAGTRTQSAVNVTGGNATTAVTVVQDAAVTAVNAVTAVAPVKQVETITSVALAAGQNVTVAGLTFTASKALTAAEVAASFANLSAGDKQGDAPASNGIYSGTFGAYTTGAVITTGNVVTVEATATTAAPAAAIALSPNLTSSVKTVGVAAVAAVTGVAGIVGGAVVVADGSAAADTIQTVTLNGYGAASSVASDALTGLNLANSAQALTVTNNKATTLDLSLNNVTGAAAIGLGNSYTSLNVATAGKDSAVALNAAAATALTLSGTQRVDLTGSILTALKTATVTGAAGATANVSFAAFTGFDASAASGNNTITIDATKATYKGGSGVDAVTLSAATPSKAVSLGAGNDTLTLAAGTTATAGGIVLDGGDGSDTLVMTSADAVTASAAITFETQITGFEVLSLGATAVPGTVDLANMDDISMVISAGNTAALTLKNMANAGSLTITGTAVTTDVQLTDATGTADSLTVQVVGANAGTVKAAGVETINVVSSGVAVNTVNLQTAAATTVNVSGSQSLSLNLHADTVKLTLVDASGLTGNLTTTTNGTVAQTVKGGSGNDTITANFTGDVLQGGAGNDTLFVNGKGLVQLTGGAGVDTFNVSLATSNSSNYATILDFGKGDLIKFSAAANDFKAAKINLAATAVFQDYANEAVKSSADNEVSWFQFGGDTYLVENSAVVVGGNSFTNGTDIIVKLAGLVDLSTGSFSLTANTLELI